VLVAPPSKNRPWWKIAVVKNWVVVRICVVFAT
jgi:hypothetical protein